ncbi:MAG: hypothetical protein M1830_000242 [Pleopsidium flavum]|nr:MAG: hypothetical protein M1830_000242 [Pleopsidium flavum]
MAQEYQLKGLSSLDLKSGEKREVEVEGIENGKVLLVRMGDKTHAMSSNCTHYGAPLVKGILTPDGRLTCAWHGACFKVDSGDVEDAPALDPLAKFKITEKNGAVYITGDEATIKSSRRSPNHSCSAQGPDKVIIVGGGSGTMGALLSLREQGYKGTITVISREPNPPIDRTKLSKALIPDVSKVALREKDWYSSAAIEMLSDEVTGVDFSNKNVSTKSGQTYHYTKLVLAMGGTPKMLPLPGFKDLDNVFLLRTIADVQSILGAVGDKGKKIVVIGSSFIGMEVANCLSKANTVTVVGMEKAPLERVMGEEVGNIFKSILEKNGVKFHMEAGVEKATPASGDSKNVGAIHLKDGTSLEADLVILGIGVAPATEFLKEAKGGVELEKDGSLRTNESFEVAGLKDVYAIGDIATYPYHGPGGNGAPTRIEHWNVAQNAGRSVGLSIARPSSKPKSFIPIFWSALGQQLRYCGNTMNGWDDLVLKGEPDQAKFAAYYANGETVVAVATMQMDPVNSKCAELMRRGRMPSKSDLKKGVDVLEIGLPSEVKI